jgi:protein-tyrosine-phosphatase
MTEILFICTANQFRSPLAAAYFTRRLQQDVPSSNWIVFSAGTWTEPGLPAHPAALAEAEKLGLDLTSHRTREVNSQLLNLADLIVVMEQGHKEALECEFPDCKGRIVLLAETDGGIPSEIPDPALEGFENEEAVASSIVNCIDKSFSRLMKLAESHES